MTERESLIALTHFVKFGPAGLKKLYARLGSWHDLWSADSSSLNHAGLDLKIATEFVAWRTTFNIDHSWKILDAEKIQIILSHSEISVSRRLSSIIKASSEIVCGHRR